MPYLDVPHTSERHVQALDPVDGTKGFLRNDQYAVALALIDAGKVMLMRHIDGVSLTWAQVVMGVLGCPNFPVDLALRLHHITQSVIQWY